MQASRPSTFLQPYVTHDTVTGKPAMVHYPHLSMPVVEVVEQCGSGWEVACPFCGHPHWHGRREGTRVSHCDDSSGAERQYYVQLPGSMAPFAGWGEYAQ